MTPLGKLGIVAGLGAGGYGVHKFLQWRERRRPLTWMERVKGHPAFTDGRAYDPRDRTTSKAHQFGSLIRQEVLDPFSRAVTRNVRHSPQQAAMHGALYGAAGAGLLGLIRERSLGGALGYGALGALGGAGAGWGAHGLTNMKSDKPWTSRSGQGVFNPFSAYRDSFNNGGRAKRSSLLLEPFAERRRRNIKDMLYADPSMDLAQRLEMSRMVDRLAPMQRLALEQRLTRAGIGAGVGALVARYLLNMGMRSTGLLAIVGAGLGGLTGRQPPAPSIYSSSLRDFTPGAPR